MKKLLNTLYVTSENSYLALDGENIVIYDDKKELGRVPLHNLEGIVSFGYRGTSPALMGACAERNISLCYMTPQGKFLARVTGKVRGNVILREQQYASSKDEQVGLEIAQNCILGKVHNARWVLERAVRDHSMQIDAERVKKASEMLKNSLMLIQNSTSGDELRGYEGEAASIYFSVFDELILQQKKDFTFQGRNKRPPLDKMNAMLSFVYTLLTNTEASALECVGLDPCVGYLHTERPGRVSLALDMMEELRSVLADRFVLSLVNLYGILLTPDIFQKVFHLGGGLSYRANILCGWLSPLNHATFPMHNFGYDYLPQIKISILLFLAVICILLFISRKCIKRYNFTFSQVDES